MTIPSDPPLVSIVTPVYNGEQFLAECIESVLAQTYERWEYVILDNCSTDATPAIARRYADAEPRIRYIRAEEFVDVRRNFTRAVSAISDESAFVKPLGADDRLAPACVERMVALAVAHPSVGLVGGYRLDGSEIGLVGLSPDREVFPGQEICRQNLTDGPYVTGSPTSTLVRAEFVRVQGGFYDETFLHFDTEACFAVLSRSDLGWVHEVLTFTRRHEGALTPFSLRAFTYASEYLRMLVRYGPQALGERYPGCLRSGVLHFAWLMGKQAVKLRPWRDPAFREFHIPVLARLERELGGSPERVIVRACRLLLESGRITGRRSSRLPA